MTCLNNCRALASLIHTILFVCRYSVRLKRETKKKNDDVSLFAVQPERVWTLRTNGTCTAEPRRLNLESKLRVFFPSFSFVLLHTNCCITCIRGTEGKKTKSKLQRHCWRRRRSNKCDASSHHLMTINHAYATSSSSSTLDVVATIVSHYRFRNSFFPLSSFSPSLCI